jgi:hypothetical protein
MKVGDIQYFLVDRTGQFISGKKTVNSESFQLSFEAKAWMIPEVHVLIYFFHKTGEIIYDKITVTFDESMPNKVKKWSTQVFF